MELVNVNASAFENVRHVIFGKQKQASVQNDAVVRIIASTLLSKVGSDSLLTENSVITAVTQYITDTINGDTKLDEVAVSLILGVNAMKRIKSLEKNLEVCCEQPNPESPKIRFYLTTSAPVDKSEVMEAMTDEEFAMKMNPPVRSTESRDLSLREQAEIIRDKLLEVASPVTASEIDDDNLTAIYTSRAYFTNGGKIDFDTVQPEPNIPSLLEKMVSARLQPELIAKYLGIPLPAVIEQITDPDSCTETSLVKVFGQLAYDITNERAQGEGIVEIARKYNIPKSLVRPIMLEVHSKLK